MGTVQRDMTTTTMATVQRDTTTTTMTMYVDVNNNTILTTSDEGDNCNRDDSKDACASMQQRLRIGDGRRHSQL